MALRAVSQILWTCFAFSIVTLILNSNQHKQYTAPEENAYTLVRLLEEEKTKNASFNRYLIAVAVISTSVILLVLGACSLELLISVQATNKDTKSFSLDALVKIMATRFQLVANDNFNSNLTSPSSPTPTWPIQIETIFTLHAGCCPQRHAWSSLHWENKQASLMRATA